MIGGNKVQFIKESLKIYDFDYLGNSHQIYLYGNTLKELSIQMLPRN